MMEGKKLPYKTVLAYIESTGTQYVDTGLNSTTDGFCDFEIRFAKNVPNPAASRHMPFGFSYGATARYGMWAGSDVLTSRAGINSSVFATFANDNHWHTVKVINGQDIDIDGTSTPISSGSVRVNIGLFLFATITSRYEATSHNVIPSKIAYCKIYNTNGELIRDYIPVLNWDDEACMYDNVSNTLFYNAGTGAFLTPETNGGGYKLTCTRRSYRRSWRPSARFWCTSRRWEVAA